MAKILLTGGTGFLGGCVLKALVDDGHDVISLVRRRSDGRNDKTNTELTRHQKLVVDPAYEGLVDRLVAIKPEIIVNIAAVSRGAEDEEGIRAMIEANVLLPALLADTALQIGDVPVIQCGTSWQTSGPGPNYEPFNFYAGTKQAAEDILASFSRRGLRSVSLRMFDNYGPNDPRRKIVDLIFDAVASGTALKMSPGGQKMDLIYVNDAAAAVVAAVSFAMTKTMPGLDVFSVSSGMGVPLREVAELIGEIVGREPPIEWGGRPYRPGEIMEPNTTVSVVPGWAAKTSLREGLRAVWNARTEQKKIKDI